MEVQKWDFEKYRFQSPRFVGSEIINRVYWVGEGAHREYLATSMSLVTFAFLSFYLFIAKCSFLDTVHLYRVKSTDWPCLIKSSKSVSGMYFLQ